MFCGGSCLQIYLLSFRISSHALKGLTVQFEANTRFFERSIKRWHFLPFTCIQMLREIAVVVQPNLELSDFPSVLLALSWRLLFKFIDYGEISTHLIV